nr:unnamed protein product [Spirometra erinaceieuropaei]
MRTHLYSTFVDLTKAFDTGNREEVWKIVQKFGSPKRFTQMVRQLHDGMMARVTNNGTVSEALAMTNGVKQGCVLATTLFSLMFSAMLMDAYRKERPGIRIAYRTDGHLLNQRRMHFRSRVSTTTVHELLFADDCALNTTSEEEMQRSMDLFSAACENFRLVIDTQTGILSIYAILRQIQLRWSGHLVRMDDERLPKRLFYGDVATGSRRHGCQIRR